MNSITSTGKLIRMSHIFKADGKAAMVAANQGITWGPANGLESVEKVIDTLIPENPDSFTMHRGMALCTADRFAGKTGLIIKCTNKTKFFGPSEVQVASVEDAVALGADAISIGLTLADEKELETIRMTSELISAANRYGMPTVAHAYPSGNLIDSEKKHSLEYVGYATRVAKELGIDIIKTYWTGSGDSFAKVVEIGSPCKVVISGGPRCNTLRDCYDMTWQGIQAGCHGITYGRNIWQHPFPAAVLRGLVAIIHADASIDEAMEIASDCAGTKLV